VGLRRCRAFELDDDAEPGLHTGEHASADARFAAAASQLRGRDKLDREELRGLRRQMRAEKKVCTCYQYHEAARICRHRRHCKPTAARHELRAVREFSLAMSDMRAGTSGRSNVGVAHRGECRRQCHEVLARVSE